MIAQNISQCLVQKVCHSMVPGNGKPALHIDSRSHRCTLFYDAFLNNAAMEIQTFTSLVAVIDSDLPILSGYHTGIGYLSAAFSIKRRSVKDDGHFLALLGTVHLLTIKDDIQYLTFG